MMVLIFKTKVSTALETGEEIYFVYGFSLKIYLLV